MTYDQLTTVIGVLMFSALLFTVILNSSDASDPGIMLPTGFYPIDQSIDVPLDSRIILKARGGLFEAYSFTIRTNDENVNGTLETDCIGETCYFIFVPDDLLLPETTYTLESSATEDDYSIISTFTTGTGNAVVTPMVPTISIVEQTYVEEDLMNGTAAYYRYQLSVSNLMVTDDQNTHIYLNHVDDTGTLIAVKNVLSVEMDPIDIKGAAPSDTSCFTVSHVAQNGVDLGESDIVCAEATTLENTGDVDNDNESKGCSSMNLNPGTLSWFGLLGLVGLTTRRHR